jgi:hypothetical protein
VINTLVGTGVGGYRRRRPSDGHAIGRPTGIEIDTTGNLYIADFDNDVVRKVSGGIITTIAAPARWASATTSRPPLPSSTAPGDIGVDAAGNSTRRPTPPRSASAWRRAAHHGRRHGVAGDTGDFGPAAAARLNQPSDMKLDETGALWVPT